MTPLDELRAELRAFVAARDWQQFHDPKNLAMLVASEAGGLTAIERARGFLEAATLSAEWVKRHLARDGAQALHGRRQPGDQDRRAAGRPAGAAPPSRQAPRPARHPSRS
jgi:hypothetical protein